MSVNSDTRAGQDQAIQSRSFQEVSHRGTCPDELSQALSTPESFFKVTADGRAPIGFRCNFVSAGKIALADCTYDGTLRLKRASPGGKVLIFLPLQGSASFDHGGEEIHSTPGSAAIFEASRHADARLIGPRRHLGLFIDQVTIASHLTQMLERTIRGDLNIHPHIDLTAGAGLSLIQIVRNLHGGLSDDGPLQRSPLAFNSLCDAAIYLLLENCSHRYSNELERRAPSPVPRHVKRAIDFMQEHMAEPISLIDIALASKVSVRTLHQGFAQFRNTSPMSYLREIRIAAAHRDLLEADAKQAVADIALKWGFTHFGRFAAEYKKRFGQLPSQTLRR
ncbi:AraC family transcriptional regulator [Rhizobium chutanense]|uniref:AraC family transcriptional regulator n=1 Tax=Rhizobium chutanense TaxID=2035448 RepID=A0A3S0Q0V6_9HYPH|nr:AraC family transcriptional regulator [Rhizobium chutanense]RUL95932.1 AraC family transcriptional regulator [Rhizobium chutanense]